MNKISGMIKFPENLKNKIINYILDIFSSIKEDKSIKDFETSKYFKLEKDDFKYDIKQNVFDKFKNILVVLNFYNSSNSKIKEHGLFDKNKMEIKINIPLSNRFKLNFLNISSTIEHELIHLTQFLLNESIGKKQNDDIFVKFYEYAEKNNIDIESLSDEDYQSLLRKFKAENKYKPNEKLTGFPKEFDEEKYNELVKNEFGYIHHDQLPQEYFSVLNDVLNDFSKRTDGSYDFLINFINGKNCSNDTKKFLYYIKYNKNLYNRFIKEIYKLYKTKS